MMLTCPSCRSGLQVPDGTTAMVRCPACKTIFSPAAGLAPPEPAPEEQEEPKQSKRIPARKKSSRGEEEDERPRKKKPAREPESDEEKSQEKNRDFDPPDPNEQRKTRRKRLDDDDRSDEEKQAIKAAFTRAAIGCRLIWISIVLFMLSMVLIVAFWFQIAFTTPSLAFLVAAGAVGMVNWVLAAVGVGLCISGPESPGHWRYGIAAAVATGLHLLLILIIVSQGREYSAGKTGEKTQETGAEKWALVPTRLDALSFYLPVMIYREELDLLPRGEMNLSIVVGIAELIRILLILMLVSCLAQAAGDEDLSQQCTRAAGFACYGPVILAIVMLLLTVGIVETNATTGTMTRISFMTFVMGIYAILCGTMFPALMATRETTDACDEPFQDRIPKL